MKISTKEGRDAKARLHWVREVAKMILTSPPKSDSGGTEPGPADYEDEPLDSRDHEPITRRRSPTEPGSPRAIVAATDRKRVAALGSESRPDPASALDVGARR